jgi:dihydrofolate reductase
MRIILAASQNGLIGSKGSLPWHIPEDFRWFVRQTKGQDVIMGRRTYESIGKPLPKRRNIIVSRNATFPGVEMARTLDEALAMSADPFICGGKDIYEATWPLAHTLYLTRIYEHYNGDTYLDIDLGRWHLESCENLPGSETSPPCSFLIYRARP